MEGADIIDVVVINLGVNDLGSGSPWNPHEWKRIKNGFDTLVNSILDDTYGYPNAKIILSLPNAPVSAD